MAKFIVTGGAGFIGSAVVRLLIQKTNHEVCVLDKLTYAGNLESLAEVSSDPRFRFEKADICDKAALECQVLPAFGDRLAWHFEDPVTSDKHDAFRHTLHEIHERVKMFVLVKTKH